jgi:hypothetical protein
MNIRADVEKATPDRAALLSGVTTINGLAEHIDGGTSKGRARVEQGPRVIKRRASRHVTEAMRAALKREMLHNRQADLRGRIARAASAIIIRQYAPPVAYAAAHDRIARYVDAADAEIDVLMSYAPAEVVARWQRVANQHRRVIEAALADLQRQ